MKIINGNPGIVVDIERILVAKVGLWKRKSYPDSQLAGCRNNKTQLITSFKEGGGLNNVGGNVGNMMKVGIGGSKDFGNYREALNYRSTLADKTNGGFIVGGSE